MSVTVNVKAWPPPRLPPSWQTRSISTNPGAASSHSAQVRIGIWLLSSDPGLVRQRPLSLHLARSSARRRSMVAADIDTSSAAVSSSDVQLPEVAQHRHQLAQHRCEPFTGGHAQHRPADRQRSDDLGSVPHRPGTAPATTVGASAALSALRAWLRCQPVLAHNSSRIRPLPRLLAAR